MHVEKETQLKLKSDGAITDALTDTGHGTVFNLATLSRRQIETDDENTPNSETSSVDVYHKSILRCAPQTIILTIFEIPRKKARNRSELNKRKIFHYHYGSIASLLNGCLDVDMESVDRGLDKKLFRKRKLKPFNNYATARFYRQPGHEIALTKPMGESGDCVAYTPLESFFTTRTELGDRLFSHEVANANPHKVSGQDSDTLLMIAKRYHNEEAWYFPNVEALLKHFGLKSA